MSSIIFLIHNDAYHPSQHLPPSSSISRKRERKVPFAYELKLSFFCHNSHRSSLLLWSLLYVHNLMNSKAMLLLRFSPPLSKERQIWTFFCCFRFISSIWVAVPSYSWILLLRTYILTQERWWSQKLSFC